MKNIFLYDVHTHTNMDPMINDLDNILSICSDRKIIFNCVGTNLNDSIIAVQQAKEHKGQIYATIGIHPDNCHDLNDINKLEQLYLENKDVIVAWGEIGLDYHYENFDKEKQQLFFKKQLEIVNKYDLPVCIHVRNAEEDCFEILKMVKNPSKVWIHCFAKGKDWVQKYIDRGYMISVPGIITFKNAQDLHEAIKYIPLDKLMVETDGPWLAPIPYRGKTNYPQYVEFVVDNIAQRLNIQKEALAEKITNNSLIFFNLL
ncbi:MAG: TatD family hydrolase [Mycoplasmoidaceae bacterium]